MGGRFDPNDYIGVHERIETFYGKFPQGRIITTVLEHDRESGFVMIRAEVFREPDDAIPAATGHAYELRSAGHVQAGSYVEVCETSSVGRALALLGFEVRRGTGREENRNVERHRVSTSTAPVPETILDKEIKASLEVLDYTEGKLNVIVAKDFHFKGDWKGMPSDKKREVLDYLNNLANEKANT